MNNKIKVLVNMLIPISLILTFTLLELYQALLKSKIAVSSNTQDLSLLAKSMLDADLFHLISVGGLTFSVLLFIVWIILIVKSRAEKYVGNINKAVISVLAIWISATIVIPLAIYLLYKPIFTIIK